MCRQYYLLAACFQFRQQQAAAISASYDFRAIPCACSGLRFPRARRPHPPLQPRLIARQRMGFAGVTGAQRIVIAHKILRQIDALSPGSWAAVGGDMHYAKWFGNFFASDDDADTHTPLLTDKLPKLGTPRPPNARCEQVAPRPMKILPRWEWLRGI